MTNITVVGLGYVGLPLACLCAEKGHKVYGLDIDKNKVDLINNNQSPIDDEYIINKLENIKNKINATINANECIPNSEVVIVCVPTPADKNNSPDLTALMESASMISKFIKKDTLLVIESTIYPGTIEEVVIPILKKQKFDTYSNDIFVAHCPERIDPGNKKWTIENLPRVVGGITKEATKRAAEFYRSLVEAGIVRSGRGKVRLLKPNELPADWDPVTDTRDRQSRSGRRARTRSGADGQRSLQSIRRRETPRSVAGGRSTGCFPRDRPFCDRSSPSAMGVPGRG